MNGTDFKSQVIASARKNGIDLIGFAPTCLVRPEGAQKAEKPQGASKSTAQKRGDKSAKPARDGKRGDRSTKPTREGKHTAAPRAAGKKPAVPTPKKQSKSTPKNQPQKRRK